MARHRLSIFYQKAEIFLMEIWEEDIQQAEAMRKQFDDDIKAAEEEWQKIKKQNRITVERDIVEH